jgi:hypothetical protein
MNVENNNKGNENANETVAENSTNETANASNEVTAETSENATESTEKPEAISEKGPELDPAAPIAENTVKSEVVENSTNDASEQKTDPTASDNQVTPEEVKQPLNKKIVIMATAIEKMVADRGETNLPAFTPDEILNTVKEQTHGITIVTHYNEENKNEGYFNFTEFGQTTRIPAKGYFVFGTDYSVGK